ncbi:kinase-like protein [Tilletiaria anomala UBC 951]|uniref:non-specific serine/threonine protein kinase n=1 Tax=Tilletiaria anomala (strain ATCC 24038 / CBS 436.72 / UBC 951) TaxID=1037660 RepID=A0A066VR46_TILAU|nr:kinase-like protein [Tilletiaria anomala UBC 951]KDN43916.1 kinase-like protein [Tilletiaria anomala UBC 951]
MVEWLTYARPCPSSPLQELEKIGDEIEALERSIRGLAQNYQIVDKLGEGTFSTVYKAIDVNHLDYFNRWWTWKTLKQDATGRYIPSTRKTVYVALKRIYVTSSPARILNELELMEKMRPYDNVAFLITAWRHEDQIMAVMPYSRHQDFREYYRKIPLSDLKCYFRCLFGALESVHSENIMHRDVKPANFLYDPATGYGTLCDFGLAELFDPLEWRGKCHHVCPSVADPHGTTAINHAVHSTHLLPGGALGPQKPASSKLKSAMAPPERVGYLKDDPRPSVRANRAGTRGFRAPEVLLKCQDQTVSIDIWSAGIVMLAFLTKRFPLFNANDDNEALLEIATIFGRRRMEQCAMLHNRTFKCNIPSVEEAKTHRIPDWIKLVNPSLWNPGDHPDPLKYSQDVAQAVDLCRECLHLDCTRRLTASQLLQHPFLGLDLHDDGM